MKYNLNSIWSCTGAIFEILKYVDTTSTNTMRNHWRCAGWITQQKYSISCMFDDILRTFSVVEVRWQRCDMAAKDNDRYPDWGQTPAGRANDRCLPAAVAATVAAAVAAAVAAVVFALGKFFVVLFLQRCCQTKHLIIGFQSNLAFNVQDLFKRRKLCQYFIILWCRLMDFVHGGFCSQYMTMCVRV